MPRILPLSEEGIPEAIRSLKEGKAVIFPTETVYGVGVDAFNIRAVEELYRIKRRPPNKLFTLHIASVEDVRKLVVLGEKALTLIESLWPGPLTIIVKRKPLLPFWLCDSDGKVGLRLPAIEAVRKMISGVGILAASSANISGRRPSVSAQEAAEKLPEVELVLDGGVTKYRKASTVLDLSSEDDPVILRKGVVSTEEISKLIGRVRELER